MRMKQSKRSNNDLRRQHNADLLRRMRSGDSLTTFDSKSSWFPPRPVIKKDVNEMARVYDAPAAEAQAARAEASSAGSKIVALKAVARATPRDPMGEAS
jgi:hypothetical protein